MCLRTTDDFLNKPWNMSQEQIKMGKPQHRYPSRCTLGEFSTTPNTRVHVVQVQRITESPRRVSVGQTTARQCQATSPLIFPCHASGTRKLDALLDKLSTRKRTKMAGRVTRFWEIKACICTVTVILPPGFSLVSVNSRWHAFQS
jgi:hypothetical protein